MDDNSNYQDMGEYVVNFFATPILNYGKIIEEQGKASSTVKDSLL